MTQTTNTPPELPQSLHIRRARVEDLGRLIEMIRALAAHHGDTAGITAHTLWRDAFGARPLLRILVAEKGTAMLGYAALSERAQFHLGSRGLSLDHLFVAEAWRGQGIGQALMAAARDLAAETGAAYLVVGTAADNLAAQGFYAGLGMVPVETGGPRFRFDIEPRPESGKGGC